MCTSLLATGYVHPHRRTRSESDAKLAPPPDPKRVKLDSPPPEEPPNSRTPPEVNAYSMLLHAAVYHEQTVIFDIVGRGFAEENACN